jgi:hypothetical protein
MAVTAESNFALLDLARSERPSNLSKGRFQLRRPSPVSSNPGDWAD